MKTLDHAGALERVLASMRQTIAAGDWTAAQRINEQLMTVFMDGVFSEDRSALARMRDQLAAFRSEAGTDDEDLDPRRLVKALLDANVMFATIAARRRPQGVTIPIDSEAAGAREKVLKLLKGLKGTKAMATSELAEAADVRPETMSRLLTALKLEGLVTSRKAGRKVLSRLTPRGQRAAGDGSSRRIEIRVEIPRELVRRESLIFSENSQLENRLGRLQKSGRLAFVDDFVVEHEEAHCVEFADSPRLPEIANDHNHVADNRFATV